MDLDLNFHFGKGDYIFYFGVYVKFARTISDMRKMLTCWRIIVYLYKYRYIRNKKVWIYLLISFFLKKILERVSVTHTNTYWHSHKAFWGLGSKGSWERTYGVSKELSKKYISFLFIFWTTWEVKWRSHQIEANRWCSLVINAFLERHSLSEQWGS